jgi:polysaccharide export outer membrane protein
MSIRKIQALIGILVISNALFAQSFNEDFLKSLPDNIQEDLKREAALDLTMSDAELISSPQTRVKNVEQALQEARRILERIENDMANQDNLDSKKVNRFGDKFFSSFQSTFLPVNEPNANPSYILDIGDILTLQLVGQFNQIYDLAIKRNGAINVPELGDIFLAGLPMMEAVQLVKNTISQTFIGGEAYLSLRKLRDMNVMIVGNVPNPGMYTLSGGSSALSLINAAGGIDNSGSYRVIEHKRNGKVINIIDLYSLFIDGDTSNLVQLRSGDSIIVRPSLVEVQITGGVANPAIYEIKDTERLDDIFNYAGRLKSTASGNVSINRRGINGEFINIELSESQIPDYILTNGDSIEVPYVEPRFNEARKVILSGEVKIPGTYFIDAKTKLSELINKAGGYTDSAYPMAGVFTRVSAAEIEQSLKDRSYNELLRFLIASQNRSTLSSDSLITFLSLLKDYQPTGRVVTEFEISELEKNPSKDRIIAGGDKIHIPAFVNQVYVYGEVLNPSSYEYNTTSSFNDYIKLSGGFSRSADENKIILISPDGTATSVKIGFLNSISGNKQILPGSLIYVPQYIGKVDGISLASAVAPIVSSFALSIASLNSINN